MAPEILTHTGYAFVSIIYLQNVKIITSLFYVCLAVSWIRQLVTGLLPWRPGFMTSLIHVRFMVDKVALGQFSSQSSLAFPCRIIPPGLHTHVSSGG
jgi:hypothetical protein